VIAAQQKQYSTAIERINRAIELKPTEATFHNNLGNVYLEQNQFQPAGECYLKALQLKPGDADVEKKLVIACERLLDASKEHHETGRLPDVEACHPIVANFYNCVGDIYRQQKQLTKAIEFYQKAIQLQPEYAPTYLCLRAAYDELDRLGKAIA
jgi:tetratricopeptide (TPR) repeat protein